MERSLIIVSTGLLPRYSEILTKLTATGFKVLQSKRVKWNQEQATDFFQSQIQLPGFDAMIQTVISGPFNTLCVQRLSIYPDLPELLALYNCPDLYCSKTLEDGLRDIQFFFPNGFVVPFNDTKAYLEDLVYPVLLQGLSQLCKEWLGHWLLHQNPEKPLIIEPSDSTIPT